MPKIKDREIHRRTQNVDFGQREEERMTKIDVIDRICEKLNLSRKEVVGFVDSVFDIIRDSSI